MQITNAHGIINEHTIHFTSYTFDKEQNQQHTHPGFFVFRETLFSHESWTWAILELVKFQISFFGNYVVNFDVNDKENTQPNPFKYSTAGLSYHGVREWIHSMLDWGCRRMLEPHPNCVLFNQDGQPAKLPEQEIMEKAYALYKEARPESIIRTAPTPAPAAAPTPPVTPVVGESQTETQEPAVVVESNKKEIDPNEWYRTRGTNDHATLTESLKKAKKAMRRK